VVVAVAVTVAVVGEIGGAVGWWRRAADVPGGLRDAIYEGGLRHVAVWRGRCGRMRV
jgi:hypothetical protein